MKAYFKRIWEFLKERANPFTLAPMGLIHMLLSMLTLGGSVAFTHGLRWEMVLYFILSIAIPVVIRCADEVKDYDTDLLNNPDRPVASGRVLLSDVKILGYTLTVVLSLAAYSISTHPWLITFCLIYLWLFYKFFYAPNLLGNDLILALITHNPLLLVVNLTAISLACDAYDVDLYTGRNLAFAVFLWLPAFIWETGRKLRIEEQETGYQTYTKVLGKPAALLPLVGAVLEAIMGIYVFSTTEAAHEVSALLICATVFYGGFIWIAHKLQIAKVHLMVRPWTELYVFVVRLGTVICLYAAL